MSYLARIEGTFRQRTRINLLFFSVVGPWKSESFHFEQELPEQGAHWAWQPVRNVPVAASVDVTSSGATFGLQVLQENFPLKHVSFPIGTSQSFHFEPLKGVILEGTARLVSA